MKWCEIWEKKGGANSDVSNYSMHALFNKSILAETCPALVLRAQTTHPKKWEAPCKNGKCFPFLRVLSGFARLVLHIG